MDSEINSYVVLQENQPTKVFIDKQKANDYAEKYHGTVEVVKLRIGG